MKKALRISLLTITMFIVHSVNAQQNMPSVIVTELNGSKKDIQELLDSSKITVLVFWTVWSHIGHKEIENLLEMKDERSTQHNAEIVLINMDDSRNTSKVKPMVNGHSWTLRCFLDINADLKRALNINDVPYTVIIKPSLQVFWKKVGYFEGDEELILSKIKEAK